MIVETAIIWEAHQGLPASVKAKALFRLFVWLGVMYSGVLALLACTIAAVYFSN